MRKFISIILSGLIAFSDVFAGSIIVSAGANELDKEFTQKENYAENSAIVELKSTNQNLLKGDNYFGYDIKVKKSYNFGKLGDKYVSVAYLTSSKYSTEQIISAVKTKNTVVKAQPNYKKKALSLTDDTYAKYQWALDNNGQNGGTSDKDLNPEAVWNSGVTSSEKVIAIVDTGFDFKNEELKDNVWTNENTRDLPGLHGYDFVNLDTNPQDDNGHGSHCAGIIAATANNQKGISGINQSAKIMALKVLDEEGSGYDSDILAAFNYIYEAQNLGINVASVNCSLGGKGDGDSVFKDIFDAIGKKGALICVSAGNESSNNDEYGVAPANVNSPYVISVAASNENDELASFSNYGTEKVDVAAPGTNILSTVSYDCYNPTIYDSERQNRVSQFFTDFNDNVNIIKIGKERNTLGTISVEKSTDTYFGTEGSSAKITIKGARQGDCFYVKIPYTAVGDAKKTDTVKDSFKILMQGPNADNNKEESLLTFVDTVDNELAVKSALGLDGYYFSNKRNYWSHIDLTPASIQKDGQQRALTLAVAVNDDYDEDFVLYIDDLGISKPTEDTSIFEKYDFYNGTSMATPYVTGAVALLSDFHKDLSPIQLKALVMNSVRKTQELSQKIVSGGVFDLSKALTTDSIAPIISNAKSGNKQITVEGVYFGKTPSAYINGTQAKIISSSDEKIVIDASGFVYKNVKVAVENENGIATAKLRVLGTSLNFATKSNSGGEGTQLISDGTNLYLVDINNMTIGIKEAPHKADDDDYEYDLPVAYGRFLASSATSSASESTYEYFNEISNEATVEKLYPEFKDNSVLKGLLTSEGKACYLNGKIWFIANYALSGNHYKLVSYNLSTFKWAVEGKLPDDFIAKQYSNSILTVYNGKIYLLGGINYSKLENGIEENFVSKMVRVFDEKTDKWSALSDMPEGRAFSDVRQIGNKLVVSFGSDGTILTKKQDLYSAPKTMIFDGSKWTVSNAKPLAVNSIEKEFVFIGTDEKTDFSYDNEDDLLFDNKDYYKLMPVFQMSGGISADSVIYTGLDFDGMGQFVTYNPTTDDFGTLSYYINQDPDYEMLGASVGNKYYIYYHNFLINYDEDDDKDDNNYKLSNNLSSSENDSSKPITRNIVYSFVIKSGNIKITKGKITGGDVSGTGEYLPGQSVTITAKADKTHKFAWLTVGGTKYTKASVTVLTSKNISVSAAFNNIDVKSIKLNFKKKTLNLKKKATIKVTYNPTNATVKTVTFTSSNKKVASVNSKGVVTAKKVGKAVITVKTKNGKKAKCTIIVKKTKKKK